MERKHSESFIPGMETDFIKHPSGCQCSSGQISWTTASSSLVTSHLNTAGFLTEELLRKKFRSPWSRDCCVSSTSSTLKLCCLDSWKPWVELRLCSSSPDRMNPLLSHGFAFGLSPCLLVPSPFLEFFMKRQKGTQIQGVYWFSIEKGPISMVTILNLPRATDCLGIWDFQC